MSSLFGPVSAAIASLVFLPLPKHPMQPPPPQECVRSCAAELTFVPPPFWDFTLIVTNGTATESCVKCGGCSYTWIWEFDPAEVCRWSYQTPNHGATTYGGAGGAAGPYEGIDFMQLGCDDWASLAQMPQFTDTCGGGHSFYLVPTCPCL